LRQFVDVYIKAFPDIKRTIEDILVEGNKVANRYRVKGMVEGNKVANRYRVKGNTRVNLWGLLLPEKKLK